MFSRSKSSGSGNISINEAIKLSSSLSQSVSVDDYSKLWSQLHTDPSFATEFAVKLLQKIDEVISIAKDRRSIRRDPDVYVEYLINTLIYLKLFCPVDSTAVNRILGSDINKWNKNTQLPTRFESILLKLYSDKTNDAASIFDVMSTDFYSFSELTTSVSHTLEQIFPFFVSYVDFILTNRQLNHGMILWSVLLKQFYFFETYLQNATGSQKSPLVIEIQMMLLCTLNQLITRCPLLDINILDAIIGSLKRLLLWPVPYSKMVQSTIDALTRECINPGTMARHRFLQMASLAGAAKTPSTYLLFDKDCPASQFFTSVCGNPRENTTEADLRQILKCILTLGVVYDNSRQLSEISDEIETALERVTEEEMSIIYHNISDMHMYFSGTSPQELSCKRLEVIRQLCPHLTKIAKPISSAMDRRRSGSESKRAFDIIREVHNDQTHCIDSVLTLPQYRCFATDLDINAVDLLVSTCSVKDSPNEDAMIFDETTRYKVDPNGVIDYGGKSLLEALQSASTKPSKTCQIICVGDNFVLHHLVCCFASISRLHEDLIRALTIQVFIIPVGENDVGNYVAAGDAYYRKCIFSLFNSTLAMCPLLNYSELENSLLGEPVHERYPKNGYLPHNCMKQSLYHYVSGATNTCRVKIYLCKCYYTPEDFEKKNPVQIPFVSKVEVGINVAMRKFAHSLDTDSPRRSSSTMFSSSALGSTNTGSIFNTFSRATSMSSQPDMTSERVCNDSVLLDKNFTNFLKLGNGTTDELGLTLHSQSLADEWTTSYQGEDIQAQDKFEPVQYQTIVIASCPVSKSSLYSKGIGLDLNSDAIPLAESISASDPGLSVRFIPLPKGRKSNVNDILTKVNQKKQKDLDALNDAVLVETVSQVARGAQISASDPSKPFEVAIDGKIYGKFFRVDVTKCETARFIPIQTFLPVT